MPKQGIPTSEQEMDELRRANQQTKDAATRTRYQAVRLYVEQYPVDEICHLTGCQRTSQMEWCQKYRQQDVDGLRDHRGGPHRAKLSAEQLVELGEKLNHYCPRDLFGTKTLTASGQPCLPWKTWWLPASAGMGSLGTVAVPIIASWLTVASATNTPKRYIHHGGSVRGWILKQGRKKLIDSAQDAPETLILTEDAAWMDLQATPGSHRCGPKPSRLLRHVWM